MSFNLIHSELIFIKYFAYGVPLIEIKKRMNITCNNKLRILRESIHYKLQTDCDLCMIKKSYENHLFSLNNYFLKNHENIAFGTAYNLYMLKEICFVESNLTLKELYVKILLVHAGIINTYKIKNLNKWEQ